MLVMSLLPCGSPGSVQAIRWQAPLSDGPPDQSQNMNVFKDRCFENLKNVGNWCNIATVAKIFFMARAVNFLLAALTWV